MSDTGKMADPVTDAAYTKEGYLPEGDARRADGWAALPPNAEVPATGRHVGRISEFTLKCTDIIHRT